MHIVTIPEGIDKPIPVAGGIPLEGGKRYICTNAFAGSLLQTAWRVVIGGEMWKLSPLLNATPYREESFDPNKNWNGKHIWLMRGGGWGDLLMLTPVIRQLRQRWPKCKIHVARGDAYDGAFNGLEVIEEKLPIEFDKIDNKSILVTFEDWIEGHPNAEKIHMAQHFADRFSIDLKGDMDPDYRISNLESAWAQENFPRGGKQYRVGVQFMASAIYRTYPHTNQLIARLLGLGNVEVFLFGATGQINIEGETPAGLTNLSDTKYSCDFRKSAAVAKTCDCIIAPDSAMVHLASAINVPYVGLYGPVSPSLRLSGKNGKGIEGLAPCAPCFYHAARPTDFPAGMPCAEAGKCVALDQISPKDVVDTAMKLISPIIQLPNIHRGNIVLPS